MDYDHGDIISIARRDIVLKTILTICKSGLPVGLHVFPYPAQVPEPFALGVLAVGTEHHAFLASLTIETLSGCWMFLSTLVWGYDGLTRPASIFCLFRPREGFIVVAHFYPFSLASRPRSEMRCIAFTSTSAMVEDIRRACRRHELYWRTRCSRQPLPWCGNMVCSSLWARECGRARQRWRRYDWPN